MLHIKSIPNHRLFILLWAVSITLGWTIIIYPGFIFRNMVLSSWTMLLPVALRLFSSSLLLGGLIGLLQYLLCRFNKVLSSQWIFASAISYGIGITVAFLFLSAMFGLVYPEIFSSSGVSFLIMPSELIMLFGGGMTALIQAIALRNVFFRGYKEILLWALAMALIWELGIFLTSVFMQADLPLSFQSGLAGLVIGLGTALLLNIQINTLNNPGALR